MRIIHTSDWHLGQHFFTKSRAAEHQAFLHWLIEQIKENQVDALIVAGDIFDTGAPPSYARELYNRFVVELQPTNCQLVVLGGNHDSVSTLNESRGLLSYLNTTVISCASSNLDQQVIILKNRQNYPAALLCAIPFLRPRDLVTSQAGESGGQKQLALQEAIAAHYQALYQRAVELRTELGLPLPIIATGHLTTVGVTTSDSVRDIYIGTLDAFPAHAFPPADYIALGHIHRAQQVAKTEHIRYSGSPIALSFDELSKEKSVYLVEFAQQALASVTPIFIPQFQPMQLIKGDLAQIEQQLTKFADHQGLPVWLDIEVATQDYLTDIQRRIQALAAELPVEVVLLRRSKEQRNNSIERQEKETLNELSVTDVFERRLALEADLAAPRQERMRQMFNLVVEDITQGKDATEEQSA
ncbi:TPA: exonuclease subunit SbcD [Yersinia enterocolitica]|uniref:Nuclease SbcCD subunit D n=2 Tax=Yersinia enterocolitica TaxID=630 RepID=A0A0H3NRY6_YERE1|nr:exonuclease subunit SbcD [Yersinia enterocolitica]EHB21336.1 exonuclease subunit SbcD [Yersinia enterocolitica subsp. palearctica PhRBD_Ye1]EKN3313635.1 exonuclease subunit SbcD [Yersinia enterocolitica]EKN3317654.1 exonuclease subunit SbcD [Yersinia enterocolitica]EKN3320287.1 exonuclease subunit SbcD [Yersinia enterocolitica]EKN3321368.1 exonuclease subunit SbcD [Yersinia enterocolitica]